MNNAPKKTNWILWGAIIVFGLIFLVWMIDFIRCKMKKDGCTKAWWRFNGGDDKAECTSKDDCDDGQSCKDGKCVDDAEAYKRRRLYKKRKYAVPPPAKVSSYEAPKKLSGYGGAPIYRRPT